jgi:uncharacterized membrane protein
VSQYAVILSLHILAAVLGFATAGAAHSTMFRLRRAQDMSQVRSHLAVLDKVGPLFGISALLLIVLGGYLIHLSPSNEKFHWSDGWILTALITLVLVEAVGGLVIGRGVKAIIGKLESAPDGPVTAETRALLADRPVWLASHATTAVIASVVFVMVGKPSAAGAIVTVVIGAVVGIVSAIPFAKPVAVSA